MFESTVANGPQKLGLQKEVAETGRVNTDIAALFINIAAGGEIALLAVRGRSGLGGLDLLIGVVDEIFFTRHDCDGKGGLKAERLELLCLLVVQQWRWRKLGVA